MYELFSDRAKKALVLSNSKAQELRHEYIGTEHLLLSLFKVGGTVLSFFEEMNLRLDNVEHELSKSMKEGYVGTEHLLFFLLKEPGIASKTLNSLGVNENAYSKYFDPNYSDEEISFRIEITKKIKKTPASDMKKIAEIAFSYLINDVEPEGCLAQIKSIVD